MKSALLALCTLLLSASAHAGPRHMNANFNSKFLGSLQINVKVSEPAISQEVRPETWADIQKDNGQIIAMNCVTAAKFADVTKVTLRVIGGSGALLTKDAKMGVTVSNSYGMHSEFEVCKALPLFSLQQGAITNSSFDAVQTLQVGGEELYLRVTVNPFTSLVDAAVSGDRNRISLDNVDLFSSSGSRKSTINFSIYQQKNGMTS